MPEDLTLEPFQPREILEVLERHGIEYVLIGGFAAILQGSPILTNDIDITPLTDEENYRRLSLALIELDARVRTAGVDPLPFSDDARSLAEVSIWNLTTRYGDLDVTVKPSGTGGYPDLRRDALIIRVGTVDVTVASLADVVRSKGAANRDKDRRALPVLRELVAKQTIARAKERRRPPR